MEIGIELHTHCSGTLFIVFISHSAYKLQVIYDDVDSDNKDLDAYVDKFEAIDVKVVLVNNNGVLSCPLRAQLQRIFAFTLDDLITNSEDVIVTADVDSFTMIQNALNVLNRPKFDGWIFQYKHTLRRGYTFAMDYIAFRQRIWKQLFKDINSPIELTDKYYEENFLNLTYTWDHDQLIISRVILESGLCSLPAHHTLWREVGLDANKYSNMIDESDSKCFYGEYEWNGCNEMRRYYERCLKWHFLPT